MTISLTLADDYVARGRPALQSVQAHMTHVALVSALQRPVLERSRRAERFRFMEDPASVVDALVEAKKLDNATVGQLARLPFEATWMEWTSRSENTSTSYEVGYLMLEDGELGQTNVVGVMSDFSHEPRSFGCWRLPTPPTNLRSVNDSMPVAVSWFTSGIKDERMTKMVSAMTWELFDALFLLSVPRAVELRKAGPSRQVRRACERRGEVVPVEYKEVVVRLTVPRPIYEGGGDQGTSDRVAGRRRLHHVASYLRTYRKGRETPLVTIVDEHWRGDEKLGVVVSDRRIER